MITERQIQLVKNSWRCSIDAEMAGKLFYGRLFEVAPDVRHLFQDDIKFQARKLMNMIKFIVARLPNLDEVIEEVKSLARRHNHYGAEPAHYKIVGECLLWTLERVICDKWNDEIRDAWTAVYVELANAMINNRNSSVAA